MSVRADSKSTSASAPSAQPASTAALPQADVIDLDAELEIVSDYAAILGYGIMSTPALAIDGTVVVVGRVPKAAALRELLSQAAAR